jgi:hypothetical protein
MAMQTFNPNKAGLVLGALIGGWHLLWSLLVAIGWAQVVIDFVLWMHFIKPVYVVEDFSPGRALILIVVTAAVGYGFGACFGLAWNRVRG